MGTTVPFTTAFRPQQLLRHFSSPLATTGFSSKPPISSLPIKRLLLPLRPSKSLLLPPSVFLSQTHLFFFSLISWVFSSFLFCVNFLGWFLAFEGATNEELGTSSSPSVGENDLLIVGPGVLGRLVAQRWKEEHLGCQIHGQTVTTDHHQELIEMGMNPSLKGTESNHKFSYVIFCATPSRSPDFAGDVREAALSWNGEGSFLFTSSSASYDCNDNGQCDEDTREVPMGRSFRTDVLLQAENVILVFGGCVVRLAGLYKADRGAHTYWLEKGTVEIRPDHILNLIHYKDAASLSVTILKKKPRGRIFLGCDNHPLSRQEVMDLVNRSAKFSKKFEACSGGSFWRLNMLKSYIFYARKNDPLGKRLNNLKNRQELGWEPKYPCFTQFLETL